MVRLKTVKCCGNCKYFVFGDGPPRDICILDGTPMHCQHPQFLKEEYKERYYKGERFYIIQPDEYYTKDAMKVQPYNYCSNWEERE